MKLFFLIISVLFTTTVQAQYMTAPCSKKSGNTGQFCLVKVFQSNEEFSASEVMSLREEAIKNPNLPWLQAIDSNRTILNDLSQASSTIKSADQNHYNELLTKLKSKMNAPDLLEAASIFLANNPSQILYFNSENKDVIDKMASALSIKQKPDPSAGRSKTAYKHCKPNLEKYNQIIEDQKRCTGVNEGSANQNNFYAALAEIAACEDYSITQIGVTQSYVTRSLTKEKPCIVNLKDSSASIGGGTVDIKANGNVFHVKWDARHDLTGQRNDLMYWRDQLEPQVIELLNQRSAEPSASGSPYIKTGK